MSPRDHRLGPVQHSSCERELRSPGAQSDGPLPYQTLGKCLSVFLSFATSEDTNVVRVSSPLDSKQSRSYYIGVDKS
ncbi:hypothetical protein H920_17242 [Fukomys damarensis]|uniref:Uncharacterized protein n=1 Tax=Fukomys damarensis TaxID=885580 RepID=A0A091CTQ4_FUKDA|nr:hypothetical protein H920_17242 [Fukomys damarensis]